jgi:hypothetical protein
MGKSNRYFDFLCNIVGKAREYSLLLGDLHGMEFYSLIPNDDNRGEDGLQLRRQFLDEVGPTGAPSVPQGPCTVLEMMVGLSFRLEFETAQSRWEKTPSEWFWILIDNLGLTECTNLCYKSVTLFCDVFEKVSQMLQRGYNFNGEGGLFPLKNAKKDQRRVEIWYQMSAYILENYPI